MANYLRRIEALEARAEMHRVAPRNIIVESGDDFEGALARHAADFGPRACDGPPLILPAKSPERSPE
jgi:hypothetical protein